MRHRYRMRLYSTEHELPTVVELAGAYTDIEARMKIIAALDLTIFKAELWDRSSLVMTIDEVSLAAIRSQSSASEAAVGDRSTFHPAL